jgi:hypothetical protein
MKHAREDYNRIQDPAGLIPEDEPVFLIRGQDVAAGEAVRAWAALAAKAGATADILNAAMDHADKMDEWPSKKTPDMPTSPSIPAPRDEENNDLISADEIVMLFGGDIPLEAAKLLLEAPPTAKRSDLRRQLQEIAAARTAAPQDGAQSVRRVRHKKRGTTYHVLGAAEAQVSTGSYRAWPPLATKHEGEGLPARLVRDGLTLTVYRCEQTGKLWCRFPDEFEDGRFEDIDRSALASEARPSGGPVASAALRAVFGVGRPLDGTLDDYWRAPSGEGPHAYTWDDKPHRLLYDLIAAIIYASPPAPAVPAAGEPVAYRHDFPGGRCSCELSFVPLDEADKARGWVETPLYATPPAAPAAGEVVEAVIASITPATFYHQREVGDLHGYCERTRNTLRAALASPATDGRQP